MSTENFQPTPTSANDIHATVAISVDEALSGTTRMLNLPGGRQITIAIPPGAFMGQVLYFPGQGLRSPGSSAPGGLQLTINVQVPQFGSQPTGPDSLDQTSLSLYPPAPATNYSNNSAPIYPQLPGPMNTPPAYPTASTPDWSRYPMNTPPPPPNGGGYPPPPVPTAKPSYARLVILILLILLIIGSATGLFFFLSANQTANDHASATATSLAHIQATNTNRHTTATAIAQATASVAAAHPNPYGSGSALKLYDPLTNNSLGNNWDTTTGCSFTNGAYVVNAPDPTAFQACSPKATSWGDLSMEVNVKILAGDSGGFFFRSQPQSDHYYLLLIYQDGYYALYLYPDNLVAHTKVLSTGQSPAVHAGYNQSNTLGIVTHGTSMTVYINHQNISHVFDSTFNSGNIGLVASPSGNNGRATNVAFSELKIWA